MNLRIARKRGIVQYASMAESESMLERVGKDPLRILARSLAGVRATDPIIDRDDALKDHLFRRKPQAP
ncbi:hypothetical protein MASR2M78_16770 [Treponema sp.]